MKSGILLSGLLLAVTILRAQVDSLLAPWAEFIDQDPQAAQLIHTYRQNPLNINNAAESQLLGLPFLTRSMVETIILHRPYRSWKDLRKYLDHETVQLLKGLIVFQAPKTGVRWFSQLRSVLDQEQAQWQGNNYYYLNGARVAGKFWQLGVVAQKDVGEKSWYDYWGAYLLLQKRKCTLIMGNYSVRFGLGGLFSDGFPATKSVLTAYSLRVPASVIRPLGSAAEARGFRGVALWYSSAAWQGGLWWSKQKRDARVDQKSGDVVAFRWDGYHRSESELQGRERLGEQSGGGLLLRRWKNWTLGAVAARFSFSPAVKARPEKVNTFAFSGGRLWHYGLFLQGRVNHYSLSLEKAYTPPGGSIFSGVVLFEKGRQRWGVRWWDADKNVWTPYGRLFSHAQPFTRNKRGYYLNGTLALTRTLSVSAFYFREWAVWPAKSAELKSDWLIQNQWRASYGTFYLRVRKQHAAGGAPLWKIRLQWQYQKAPWQWMNRFSASRLLPGHSGGRAFLHQWTWKKKTHTVTFRLTLFDTDGYESKIYEYEDDLPYTFSNYALYYRGYRWYVKIKTVLTQKIQLWLKYRLQWWINVKESPARSQTKRELRLHMELKF